MADVCACCLDSIQALLGKDPEQLKPKDKDQEGANRDAGKKRSAPQGFGQVHYDPTSEDAARFELQKVRAGGTGQG
jgi:hypothetical protein